MQGCPDVARDPAILGPVRRRILQVMRNHAERAAVCSDRATAKLPGVIEPRLICDPAGDLTHLLQSWR